MVKKNTIIMSCEKYIKKLSYAYTGKLDEEIFCVSNNAYHHKVFILDEKNKIKQCYDSSIGNAGFRELGWIFFKSYWSLNEINEIGENYKNSYEKKKKKNCKYVEVTFINPIKFNLLNRLKVIKAKGGYRYLNNMPVQIRFLDKRKNEMAKIKFNDHGILEFLGFEEIKKA